MQKMPPAAIAYIISAWPEIRTVHVTSFLQKLCDSIIVTYLRIVY